MDRRAFLKRSGISGAIAAGISDALSSSTQAQSVERRGKSGELVTIHPYANTVMKGFPPEAEDQVTRENIFESQEKMRWAMQHWRELFPSQRVSRGNSSVSVLPRSTVAIKDFEFRDSCGETTTLRKFFEEQDTDAFLATKRGTILIEEYFHGMTPETRHELWSLVKSIEATVIATLLGNELDLRTPIERYIPQLANSAYAGATIRQLLDMESGIQFRYGVDPETEAFKHGQSVGPAARELGVPVGDYNFLPRLRASGKHGERLLYKETDPTSLVWAAERQTGMRFADLLRERIWQRLGVEHDADVQCDSLGHWGRHVSVTLRDLARWGQMCLQDGHFNGHRVVPAAFFADIRKNANIAKLSEAPMLGDLMPAGVGYRSYFYHNASHGDAIAGAGALGQFCYINPKHEVVIAFFSSGKPWGAAANTGESSESIFRHDVQLERERWNACHQISKLLSR